MNAVDKYLAQWAELEARAVGVGEIFNAAVVIPCTGEDESALLPIRQAQAQGALVIVIVNARASANDGVRERNAALVAAGKHAALDRVWLYERTLPEKQGVGLARKIGCDIALALWHKGRLRSPMIMTTDADADLPPDYVARAAGEGTLLFPFTHRLVPGHERVMQLYEMSLHYYVRGLAAAGSEWAFQTLGSTIAIDARLYAQVRGFPCREAAEDFYLIAKAAKLAPVRQLDGRPLILAGRASDRVPFGTGAALRKLNSEQFTLYAPEIFTHLKEWQRALADYIERGEWPKLSALVESATVDSVAALPKLTNARERYRRARETFDAFRTLKFVHALRDRIPSLPWQEALQEADFMPRFGGDLESYRTSL